MRAGKAVTGGPAAQSAEHNTELAGGEAERGGAHAIAAAPPSRVACTSQSCPPDEGGGQGGVRAALAVGRSAVGSVGGSAA